MKTHLIPTHGGVNAHVSVERTFSGVVIVRLSGEIDAANSQDVWSALASHLGPGGPRIFDLTGVTFLGVSGAEVLLRAVELLAQHDTRFATVGGRSVRHVLCAANLDVQLNLERSVSDAVLALAQQPPVPVLDQN
ncbi:STAS domain-containing protein [Hoyosella sp. YIM 151337]|uniref:STAS domain-containing protein n=1 Tax=Hoyosella sp. YIM 151337 TaxID=2992742 RepID=UPI0022367CB9|nr:STAS domain-containing protein [Hoyosella sp. YIM 151337]MCW4353614.1 STAS domain-containing protein [Hoyosella sp. YIM 151337]